MPRSARYRVTMKLAPAVFAGALALLGGGAAKAAQLPQKHPYQVTLRSYLATLTENDFAVTLAPLGFSDAYFSSNDDWHRTFILMENIGRQLPNHDGLRVAPSHFLLSNIESSTGIKMTVGRGGFIDPVGTAWWASWSYPGNPHYGQKAVKLRAFVAAAVDLMMLDAHHESGSGVRSDYIGGSLLWQAYAYLVAKSILPTNVQTAYEQALQEMFDRIEPLAPDGAGGADMETFQLVSLFYVADAIGSASLKQRARDRTAKVLDAILTAGGSAHEHGSGIDSSYDGVALYFIEWAALASGDPNLVQAAERMSRLKGQLTLPEPDGVFVSPCHYNTGTEFGATNDQWHTYSRDHGLAMLADSAKYLVWTGRTLPSWYFQGLPSPAQMKQDVDAAIKARNADPGGKWAITQPLADAPGVWAESHWQEDDSAAATSYYQPGFYASLSALEQQSSELRKPPLSRSEDYVEAHGTTFLAFKHGEIGGVLHTGSLQDQWAGHVSGLSGGGISALWTAKTGTVVLGLSRGSQTSSPDTWTGASGFQTWAVHAMSGTSASGEPFSTARILSPTAAYTSNGNASAKAVVKGPLTGAAAPGSALVGAVDFERELTTGPGGVLVVSRLSSDGKDEVASLHEMIPIFLRDGSQSNDAEIELRVAGAWQPASTQPADADRVRITRFGSAFYVAFDAQQSVKLSPSVWQGAQNTSRVRNVMIDVLGAGAPKPLPSVTEVAYTLSADEATTPGTISFPVTSGGTGGTTGDGGGLAGGGGGTSGAAQGGAGAGSGGNAGASGSAGAGEDGGCGCRTARRPRGELAWLAALLLALGVRRRRPSD